MAVWCAGWDETGWLSGVLVGMGLGGCLVCCSRQPPTQSEKYQCRIDRVSSPDDGHIVARNMYRS